MEKSGESCQPWLNDSAGFYTFYRCSTIVFFPTVEFRVLKFYSRFDVSDGSYSIHGCLDGIFGCTVFYRC